MRTRPGSILLPLLLAAVATFVWRTSASLPPVVASHFDAGGAADGFMPRGVYLAFVLALVIVVPLLVALVPAAVAGRGGRSLNIPNREYWLAPERREATADFVRAHGHWMAAAVALLLGYVHWLVVRANASQPPVLSAPGITAGLVAFGLFLAAWLVVLFARFRRRA